jgi:uncharacterized protein YutE (UPF0331/DUF86 family)
MTPSVLSARIVAARLAWVRTMLARLRALPLETADVFVADPRTPAAAESYLRRCLEALLDLGRHILAKGFAVSTAEYKDVAVRLAEVGVIGNADRQVLARLAWYRNRLVHFYDEISERELYEICTTQLADIEQVTRVIADWTQRHPERFDHRL